MIFLSSYLKNTTVACKMILIANALGIYSRFPASKMQSLRCEELFELNIKTGVICCTGGGGFFPLKLFPSIGPLNSTNGNGEGTARK